MMYHPNCKLYLGMENNGAGLAKDDSGSGNHGTNFGATAVAGKFGGAASFDKINDYMDFGDKFDVGLSSFSMGGWVYNNYFGNLTKGFMGKSKAGGDASRYSILLENGKVLVIFGGFPVFTIGNTTSVMPQAWTHVFTTFNRAGNFIFYQNGNIIYSTNISTYVNFDMQSVFKFYVGVYQDSSGTAPLANSYFDGIIDEVTWWDVALSQNNIQRLMLGMTPII